MTTEYFINKTTLDYLIASANQHPKVKGLVIFIHQNVDKNILGIDIKMVAGDIDSSGRYPELNIPNVQNPCPYPPPCETKDQKTFVITSEAGVCYS